MTELQDHLDVLPTTTVNSGGATSSSQPESAAQQRAKRRSGSLTAMLLPELQALAASMGIPAAKQRKSELVSAIQAAQSAGAASAAPAADRSGGDQQTAASTTTRTRRVATRGAGPAGDVPPVNGLPDAAPDTVAPDGQAVVNGAAGQQTALPVGGDADTGRRSRAERNGGPRAGGQSGREPARNGAAGNGAAGNAGNGAASNAAAGNGSPNGVSAAPAVEAPPTARDYHNGEPGRNDFRNGEDRNAPPRNNDGRANDGRNNDGRNNEGRNNEGRANEGRGNDGRSGNEGRNAEGRGNDGRGNDGRNSNRAAGNDRAAHGEDDDEFGASRRSRRYRDRRGRTRDRFEGASPARNDAEPIVSDDDVLIPIAGILDNVDDKNAWFIRVNGYFASADDIYVANSHIRRYGLRRGDAVTGAVKQSRDGERKEKFNPLVRLDTVNGVDPEQAKNRVNFTNLTPLYPQERLRLETEPNILTTRIIDLVMPIGKGQRALVVSPPKAGKTSVLQAIANAISVNNPECHLMVVLVDERPEEVTDMQRSVKGEVIASTFDRRPQDHTMIAELAIERAKRLVEMNHDVVVLLDSITRLGRAYNLAAPASGRILSGGVDSTALYPPKRFLGAARNIEDGGSLTIIATALVETGSTMDTVIFEEFKGTGNAELILDRKIADKRTFPAVDVDRSGTRKEEILMSSEELAVVLKLRRVLHALEPQQGIDLLLDRLKKSRTNIEFLMQISKTAPGNDDRY